VQAGVRRSTRRQIQLVPRSVVCCFAVEAMAMTLAVTPGRIALVRMQRWTKRGIAPLHSLRLPACTTS
jgi:hypothetical protein